MNGVILNQWGEGRTSGFESFTYIFYGKLFLLTPDASAYVLWPSCTNIVKLKGETCSKSHSGV